MAGSADRQQEDGFSTHSIERLFVASAAFAGTTRPHIGTVNASQSTEAQYHGLCEVARRHDRQYRGSIFDLVADHSYALLGGRSLADESEPRPASELFAELGIGISVLANLGDAPQLRPTSDDPFESDWLAQITTEAIRRIDYPRFRQARRYWTDHLTNCDPGATESDCDALNNYSRAIGWEDATVPSLSGIATPYRSVVDVCATQEARVRELVRGSRDPGGRWQAEGGILAPVNTLIAERAPAAADAADHLRLFTEDYYASSGGFPSVKNVLDMVGIVQTVTDLVTQEITTHVLVETVGMAVFEFALGAVFPCFGFLFSFGRMLGWLLGA